MCLAVPGKVVAWLEQDGPFARASVEFGGVRREVGMQCVDEAVVGDYVLVHAGIAITRVDEAQAQRILDALRELELEDDGGQELGDSSPSRASLNSVSHS